MTLRLEWEWDSAPDVRAAELAATWSKLGINVAGVQATLVEERGTGHAIRKSLDAPTYPLAEWIAFNWWSIFAPSARRRQGVTLNGAADGFAWPDLRLTPGPGYISAHLLPFDEEPYFIRFLASVEAILDVDETERELAQFVDATVRRLDDRGVAGTPLQDEWRAVEVARSDDEQREFCLVAAALGLDPYGMSRAEDSAVLQFEDITSDHALLLEVAGSIEVERLGEADVWLRAARKALENVDVPTFGVTREALPTGSRTRPWEVGYLRARRARTEIGIKPDDRLEIEGIVRAVSVATESPGAISALVSASGDKTAVAVGSRLHESSRRFLAARALGRRTFDTRIGNLLLTSSPTRYAEKVERSFAAEFLAPAQGIAALLGGNYSDSAVDHAATHFGVAPIVIEHQIENQIAA